MISHEELIPRGYLKSKDNIYGVFEGLLNTVGRAPQAIVNINHSGVSYQQAIITITNLTDHYISDLKSSQGTFLDGKQLVPFRLYPLRNKSSIKFAEIHCTYTTLNEGDKVPESPGTSEGVPDSFYEADTQIGSLTSEHDELPIDELPTQIFPNNDVIDFHEAPTQCFINLNQSHTDNEEADRLSTASDATVILEQDTIEIPARETIPNSELPTQLIENITNHEVKSATENLNKPLTNQEEKNLNEIVNSDAPIQATNEISELPANNTILDKLSDASDATDIGNIAETEPLSTQEQEIVNEFIRTTYVGEDLCDSDASSVDFMTNASPMYSVSEDNNEAPIRPVKLGTKNLLNDDTTSSESEEIIKPKKISKNRFDSILDDEEPNLVTERLIEENRPLTVDNTHDELTSLVTEENAPLKVENSQSSQDERASLATSTCSKTTTHSKYVLSDSDDETDVEDLPLEVEKSMNDTDVIPATQHHTLPDSIRDSFNLKLTESSESVKLSVKLNDSEGSFPAPEYEPILDFAEHVAANSTMHEAIIEETIIEDQTVSEEKQEVLLPAEEPTKTFIFKKAIVTAPDNNLSIRTIFQRDTLMEDTNKTDLPHNDIVSPIKEIEDQFEELFSEKKDNFNETQQLLDVLENSTESPIFNERPNISIPFLSPDLLRKSTSSFILPKTPKSGSVEEDVEELLATQKPFIATQQIVDVLETSLDNTSGDSLIRKSSRKRQVKKLFDDEDASTENIKSVATSSDQNDPSSSPVIDKNKRKDDLEKKDENDRDSQESDMFLRTKSIRRTVSQGEIDQVQSIDNKEITDDISPRISDQKQPDNDEEQKPFIPNQQVVDILKTSLDNTSEDSPIRKSSRNRQIKKLFDDEDESSENIKSVATSSDQNDPKTSSFSVINKNKRKDDLENKNNDENDSQESDKSLRRKSTRKTVSQGEIDQVQSDIIDNKDINDDISPRGSDQKQPDKDEEQKSFIPNQQVVDVLKTSLDNTSEDSPIRKSSRKRQVKKLFDDEDESRENIKSVTTSSHQNVSKTSIVNKNKRKDDLENKNNDENDRDSQESNKSLRRKSTRTVSQGEIDHAKSDIIDNKEITDDISPELTDQKQPNNDEEQTPFIANQPMVDVLERSLGNTSEDSPIRRSSRKRQVKKLFDDGDESSENIKSVATSSDQNDSRSSPVKDEDPDDNDNGEKDRDSQQSDNSTRRKTVSQEETEVNSDSIEMTYDNSHRKSDQKQPDDDEDQIKDDVDSQTSQKSTRSTSKSKINHVTTEVETSKRIRKSSIRLISENNDKRLKKVAEQTEVDFDKDEKSSTTVRKSLRKIPEPRSSSQSEEAPIESQSVTIENIEEKTDSQNSQKSTRSTRSQPNSDNALSFKKTKRISVRSDCKNEKVIKPETELPTNDEKAELDSINDKESFTSLRKSIRHKSENPTEVTSRKLGGKNSQEAKDEANSQDSQKSTRSARNKVIILDDIDTPKATTSKKVQKNDAEKVKKSTNTLSESSESSTGSSLPRKKKITIEKSPSSVELNTLNRKSSRLTTEHISIQKTIKKEKSQDQIFANPGSSSSYNHQAISKDKRTTKRRLVKDLGLTIGNMDDDEDEEQNVSTLSKSVLSTRSKKTTNPIVLEKISVKVPRNLRKATKVVEEASVVEPPKKTRKLSANSRHLKNEEEIQANTSTKRKTRGTIDGISNKIARLDESLNESTSSPNRSRRKLKPKIVFTMMDSPELESLIRQLGGSVVDSVDACTVLVTGSVKRSLKLLCAVGQSKPICSPEWLHACRKASSFLDPWDFILQDAEAEQKWDFSLRESLLRSSKTKLLLNHSFQLIVNNAADVLKGAIESCGGKCVTRNLIKSGSENVLIVSAPSNQNKFTKIAKTHPEILVVDSEAIFDGALRQEFRFQNHLL